MSGPDRTRDGFLNNRLHIDQPRSGFRAGHDSVLLAAAVPARAGESVLELGAGAGVASLCLAARVDCRVLGIEIDPELVSLARENAARNGMAERVRFAAGDAGHVQPEEAPFDHVFFNPPFHPASGQISPSPARDRARRDPEDMLQTWTRRAAELIRDSGSVTLVLRADRFDPWREAVRGEVQALPLLPRRDEAAKRVIALLYPGRAPALIRREPVVLHEDDGRPTEAAVAVLRHGAALG